MRRRRRRWAVMVRRTLRRVVYSRSSAPSIAAGAALGIFIGLTPTVGFQMIIAALLATVFRMNRLAAVVPVWVTNPFTIAPIYYFNFKVGTWVLSAEAGSDVAARFVAVGERISQISVGSFLSSLGGALGAVASLGANILIPLVIGSCIVGMVASAATYPAVLWAVGYVRRRRAARSVRRAQARLTRLEAEGIYTRTETGRVAPVAPPAEEAHEEEAADEETGEQARAVRPEGGTRPSKGDGADGSPGGAERPGRLAGP